METTIKGKNLDIGDALRDHAIGHLQSTVTKYFDRAIDANVTFSREGNNGFRADISVHPGRGLLVQGSDGAVDPYAAFDGALERIGKQLRRYKRRLTDHHKRQGEDDFQPAQRYVIEADGEEEPLHDAQPTIVAEMPTAVATLTVGEAVMRMDLADVGAVMFRNRAHGGLNVVYRRPDGNIGWIDPSDNKTAG